MRTIRRRTPGRALGALTTTLLLALLAALLLAGSALAAGHEGPGKGARPGKPTAKAPSGTIATSTPTFTWSKVKGAARYELQVSEAGTLLLKKSGLRRPLWQCSAALPTGVALTWKVRAGNGAGVGAWSASLTFTIETAPGSAKAISAFSFEGLSPHVDGTISEAAHTIALTVPSGTSVGALVATFTTSGASVAVAGTPQVSGVTANNFTGPLTYTVAAADASTQAYVVTVTVAGKPPGPPDPLVIGDPYQGGIVAYILKAGDVGYDAGVQHGLIAAAADQSAGIVWSNIGSVPGKEVAVGPPAQGIAIGTGQANTTAIVNQTATIDGQQATCTSGAAYLCDNLVEGGYSDWYLPSQKELSALAANLSAIGGFGGPWYIEWYWSSSEYASDDGFGGFAWAVGSNVQNRGKYQMYRVRAVRSF